MLGNFQLRFTIFLQEILPYMVDASLTVGDLRAWQLFLIAPMQRQRRFLPSCLVWLQWFLYDVFGFSFYSVRRLGVEITPFLVLGCMTLWRGLFSYVGNRGLVGWRRIALKGFLTKQRFVTRYNYRRLAHYFWRRAQRRWRLFRTRRRPLFFLRRYRKLRRLRYHVAFNFSWRAARRVNRLGVRWGGTYTRLFIRELLRWRAYIITAKMRYGTLFRCQFFRMYPHFNVYRYQARYRAVKVRAAFGQVKPQVRLWRRRKGKGKRFILGMRPFTPRSFCRIVDSSVASAFRRSPRRRKRRRLSSVLRATVAGIRSLNCKIPMFRVRLLRNLLRRRPLVRLNDGRLGIRRRRRRWYRPRAWRQRRRRARYLRVTLRPYVRARLRFKRHFKYRKYLKRLKRRIKRRIKRRRKYRRRWLRRSWLSGLRRRNRGLRKKKRFRVVRSKRRIRRRRFLFPRSRAVSLLGSVMPKDGMFRVVSKAYVFPLLAVRTLQSGWSQSVNLASRFTVLQNYQRGVHAMHARWVEGELPSYARLRHYRRQRQLGHFGRYRRWLCALFVNGRRHIFYKERVFPIVQAITPRNVFVSTEIQNDNLQFASAVGAGVKTQRRVAYRRRFIARVRRSRQSRGLRLRRPRFLRRRWRRRELRHLRRGRLRRKRYYYRRYKKCRKRLLGAAVCRMRRTLFRRFRRKVFVRRFFGRTQVLTHCWARAGRRWWRSQISAIRKYIYKAKPLSRRQMEAVLWRYAKSRFFFRFRFLQRIRSVTHVRRAQTQAAFFFQQGLKMQVTRGISARRVRRFSAVVRCRFRTKFLVQLQSRLKAVVLRGGVLGVKEGRRTPYLLMSEKADHFMLRVRRSSHRRAVVGLLVHPFMRSRMPAYRASRYIVRRGLGLFKAHALLTRRYPSVYDFETFDYLFSSDFLYTRFATKGARFRSQLIVMSVLRYLRPYSSFHLVRFIERFLVEGFPIYFEMSSLKQSNKEQPFPVPINLTFFRNYMLKAIATRFRAKRQVVSFQAALLTELWSWHVDPTQSILHDFLVNHYAVGLDSRFFVHYRWRVKR